VIRIKIVSQVRAAVLSLAETFHSCSCWHSSPNYSHCYFLTSCCCC